jgi:hypothetical protein
MAMKRPCSTSPKHRRVVRRFQGLRLHHGFLAAHLPGMRGKEIQQIAYPFAQRGEVQHARHEPHLVEAHVVGKPGKDDEFLLRKGPAPIEIVPPRQVNVGEAGVLVIAASGETAHRGPQSLAQALGMQREVGVQAVQSGSGFICAHCLRPAASGRYGEQFITAGKRRSRSPLGMTVVVVGLGRVQLRRVGQSRHPSKPVG